MRNGVIFGLVATIGLALVVVAFKVLTATVGLAPITVVCPQCVGFEQVGSAIFLERGASPETRRELLESVEGGKAKVSAFFGPMTSSARLVACHSERCYRNLVGRLSKSRGLSYHDTALMISPRGISVTIVAHELTHIEFHHRLGVAASGLQAVPAWFDEGLATYVSDDIRYLKSPPTNDRCRVESGGVLPSSKLAWGRRAEQDRIVYAMAGCRVARWLAANGGPKAITDLIRDLRGGVAFGDIVKAAPQQEPLQQGWWRSGSRRLRPLITA